MPRFFLKGQDTQGNPQELSEEETSVLHKFLHQELLKTSTQPSTMIRITKVEASSGMLTLSVLGQQDVTRLEALLPKISSSEAKPEGMSPFLFWKEGDRPPLAAYFVWVPTEANLPGLRVRQLLRSQHPNLPAEGICLRTSISKEGGSTLIFGFSEEWVAVLKRENFTLFAGLFSLVFKQTGRSDKRATKQ